MTLQTFSDSMCIAAGLLFVSPIIARIVQGCLEGLGLIGSAEG